MNRGNSKNIFIGALLVAIVVMSVGYAALASTLNINGTAQITSTWDVKFTSISTGTPTGSATNKVPAAYTFTTATFDVDLVNPGDSMTYDIVVKNNGTLDARLATITGIPSADGKPIQYSVTGISEGETLAAGAEKTITVKVEYDSSIQTQPDAADLTKTLSVTLNFVQI